MESYLLSNKEAAEIERSAAPALKRAWEKSIPAVSVILEKAYPDIPKHALRVVQLIAYKGADALGVLDKYLEDNLGSEPQEAQRVAQQVKSVMSVFIPRAGAPQQPQQAPASPARKRGTQARAASSASVKVLEWDDPRMLAALESVAQRWNIGNERFKTFLMNVVGRGSATVRSLPELLMSEFSWDAKRAYSVADMVAEKIFSLLPSSSFDVDKLRISWQKTGNVDFSKAAAQSRRGVSAHTEMKKEKKPAQKNARTAARAPARATVQTAAPAQPSTPLMLPPKPQKALPPHHEIENATQAPTPELLFAARIIKELGVTFTDPRQEKRFEQALVARVNDVRSPSATQEMFERSLAQGGVGIEHYESMRIMSQVEALITKRVDAGKDALLRKQRHAKQQDISLASPLTLPQHSSARASGKQSDAGAPPPVSASPSASPEPSTEASKRPVVNDITPPEQLMGPLESLSHMRLIDFRRLSSQPQLASAKIKERIVLLRQDSYAEYTRGIAAWKSSPLFAVYLTTLHEGVTIGALPVAPSAAQQQKDKLTKDEFNAIIKLNQQLTY